jgi:hypothetical protein
LANGILNPLTLLVHASLIWDTTSLTRVEINSVGLSQSNKLTRINEPLVKNIHPGVHTLQCIGNTNICNFADPATSVGGI